MAVIILLSNYVKPFVQFCESELKLVRTKPATWPTRLVSSWSSNIVADIGCSKKVRSVVTFTTCDVTFVLNVTTVFDGIPKTPRLKPASSKLGRVMRWATPKWQITFDNTNLQLAHTSDNECKHFYDYFCGIITYRQTGRQTDRFAWKCVMKPKASLSTMYCHGAYKK